MKQVDQYKTEQIVRQQQVLAHLGFYKGRIDGIWGPSTIAAKKAYEGQGFAPGIPNGGLPFQFPAKLPRGLRYEGGLLTAAGFDPAQYPLMEGAGQPVNRVAKTEAVDAPQEQERLSRSQRRQALHERTLQSQRDEAEVIAGASTQVGNVTVQESDSESDPT